MLILTIRTDKPESEIGLYEGSKQLAYTAWQAHRALADTLNLRIRDILQDSGVKPENLDGIIAYKGPGSFTGLRIGLSVANALAYSLGIPIVAESDNWIEQGINRLAVGNHDTYALPDYGAEAHITLPRK